MNRRDFLLTAAALVPPVLQTRAASGPIPVIDTHTHFYDTTRPQHVPWPPPSEKLLYAPHLPSQFRAVTRSLHVVGTVVVEASPWLEDNQWILDLAEKSPEIVGFVGNLKVGQPEFKAHLARFSAHPLYRGLRVGYPTVSALAEPAVYADLARLAEADLSLDVIGNEKIVAPTTALARRIPSLRIVLNHLPLAAWDGKLEALREACHELASCPNIFIKVSNVVRQVDGKVVEDPEFYRPTLDSLWDIFGPDRLVHATNWPVSERVAPYASVQRIVADYLGGKDRSIAEKYFWRNSHQAYRWLPRGAAAALLS